MATEIMRVFEQLGRGGFGIVHRVETPLGEVCARKSFAPRDDLMLSLDDRQLAEGRFRREVSIQRGLSHPNIVPVLNVGMADVPPWFTMPLASHTLRQRISSDRRAGIVSIAPLWDILAGLEAVHLSGYVHRDLKPENVLLVENEWAISDFGLARVDIDAGSVHSGSVGGIGTASYMSPEQYRRFHSATAPTDIYAFGCVLHDVFG